MFQFPTPPTTPLTPHSPSPLRDEGDPWRLSHTRWGFTIHMAISQGIWCSHNMQNWPPSNIVSREGVRNSFSWLYIMYMPLILAALGSVPRIFQFPKPPESNRWVRLYRAIFEARGVTLDGIRSHEDGAYHIDAAEQERLIGMDDRLAYELVQYGNRLIDEVLERRAYHDRENNWWLQVPRP